MRIEKRIPVAGGLGGGSADAAAALRAANRLAGEPLELGELRSLGATIGADVPSQLDPIPSLVTGAGEVVEPARAASRCGWCWCPAARGCRPRRCTPSSTARPAAGEALDPNELRALAGTDAHALARSAENDLEPAALSLRPELEETLDRLAAQGALAARLSGSGPDGLRRLRRRGRPPQGPRRQSPARTITRTRPSPSSQ